ncbi:hypothetical protein IFM89_015509 [Coptis chinensis]|uniref:Peroxisome biogenesis protein 22 n=1 Tax=Coptis chinensis TaxID=261450 RepID=A0A835GZ38_9MAGN|nr:hypothetical protein IFM89_015509 [Coptis chinensis]
MAPNQSNEDAIQLIKRFGAYITLKITNLFSITSLNSRSVGTVAGLALAMVLTWRLLRSPSSGGGNNSNSNQRRRRQEVPKRQVGGSSSGSNVGSGSSGGVVVATGNDDLRAQNVIDEFFQPVKPTLGQVVRQKLCEGRKVTCRLLGVILEESSPEELQKQATVRTSVLEVLLEVTKFCDLYLMDRILDARVGEKVLLALEEAGVFTSGGLVKDKVLFSSTENGRISFVRQLEPDWHIDTSPDIVFQLAKLNTSVPGVTFDKYIQLSDLNKRHSTFYVTKTPSDQFGSSAEEGTLTVVWTKDSWANPHLEQAFMSRICAPNWIVF